MYDKFKRLRVAPEAAMSADETPIACTLVPAALAGRLEWIRRMTSRSLLSHRLESSTLRLKYQRDAEDEIEQIVAGERECCSFLQFELRAVADGIELTIRAPDSAVADARWLFEQFLPEPPRQAACGCARGTCG